MKTSQTPENAQITTNATLSHPCMGELIKLFSNEEYANHMNRKIIRTMTIRNITFINKRPVYVFYNKYGGFYGGYTSFTYNTIICQVIFQGSLFKNEFNRFHYKHTNRMMRYMPKRQIDIIGMTPNRTKDGKYCKHRYSVTDLRAKCKMNGIKGYSKCDKAGLLKLLMSI